MSDQQKDTTLEESLRKILRSAKNHAIINQASSVDDHEVKRLLLILSSELSKKDEWWRAKIKAFKRSLKEHGFDDYGKHVHTYVHENRGNCGICGLSWKKAGEYEIYNNAIISVRKGLDDLSKEGGTHD